MLGSLDEEPKTEWGSMGLSSGDRDRDRDKEFRWLTRRLVGDTGGPGA